MMKPLPLAGAGRRMSGALMMSIAFAVIIFLSSCEKEVPFQHQYKFSEKNTIGWEDFKGYPPMFNDYDAQISSGFGYQYESRIENGMLVLDMNVYSFFSPLDTWVRKDSHTDAILAHEQLHYYVSETHARLFRKKLMQFAFTKNYEEEIYELYQTEHIDLNMSQYLYDTESEHSLNKANQKKWMLNIQQQMKGLEPYANESFTIHTKVPMTQQELEFNAVLGG